MRAPLRVLLSLGLLIVGVSACQQASPPRTALDHRIPPALPTPTPASAPPAVKASLIASSDQIMAGQPVTIMWSTQNADQVTLEGIGNVDLSGSRVVIPAESRTYRLLAIGPGGTQEATVRVLVTQPPPPVLVGPVQSVAGVSDTDSGETTTGSHKKKAKSAHMAAGAADYVATGGNLAGYLKNNAVGAATGQPAVSAEATLQNAIDTLPTGQVAFHHPSEMQVDEAEEVQVIISRDLTANLAVDLPQSDDTGHHEITQSQQIKISTSMKVQLNGDPYFKVTPLTSSEEQLIETSGSTEWRFTVVPLQKGRWPLHLTVTAVVRAADLEKVKDLKVLDEQVTVTISTFAVVESFIVGNWQWFCGTLLIPLAVWLWPKLRSGKTRAQSA